MSLASLIGAVYARDLRALANTLRNDVPHLTMPQYSVTMRTDKELGDAHAELVAVRGAFASSFNAVDHLLASVRHEQRRRAAQKEV